MVDSTEATQSQFLTAELVKNSPSKLCVVVDPGDYEKSDYGKKLTVGVNIDGLTKKYRPNQESAKALNQAFGIDTKDWVGKKTRVKVEQRFNHSDPHT